MANIKILLADDHKIVRDGIKLMLEPQAGIDVVDEAQNGKEVLEKLESQLVDIVVMDINMPEMDGITATRKVKEKFPEVKVLALTMSNDDLHIRQMIQAGASGYIMKSAGRKELKDAIDAIMDGKHYFSDEATESIMMDLVKGKGKSTDPDPIHITDRELEILELIVQEHTNQEIAEKLYISSRTVDAHRRNLLQKTGARNTAGLVKYAFQHNLISSGKGN
ncbi:response regulator transcription factor [Rhodohalobacter barkolensis]|uniref:DNA-binding response regulator n=1 Tax=Rhodohalobacter barkolensis TaxID=2053187 RepID=A0A2N0VHB2_9BACT|nr:response regulator transcription factor [Rhodohalobacter barkolensis]PKD43564.1 DNA-binding response regulator [Rhodohalobacter barkolensis]